MINSCARFCILTRLSAGRKLVQFQVNQSFSCEKQAQPLFRGARFQFQFHSGATPKDCRNHCRQKGKPPLGNGTKPRVVAGLWNIDSLSCFRIRRAGKTSKRFGFSINKEIG